MTNIEYRDGRAFKVTTLPDDPRLDGSSHQATFGKLRKKRRPSKKNALRAAILRQSD